MPLVNTNSTPFDIASIMRQIEEERRPVKGNKYEEDWMDMTEDILLKLGAEKVVAEFSGGNDSGGMDRVVLTTKGVQREVDTVSTQEMGWTPINGVPRPVRYKALIHPQQALINDLIEACWIPIGRAHGSFATSDDSNVAGSVTVDLTEDEEWERFVFDEGEWVTTYYCRHCGNNEVEEDGESCVSCASREWCTSCEEDEADDEDGLCSGCRSEIENNEPVTAAA